MMMPEIFSTKEEKLKANGFLLRLDKNKPKVLIHPVSSHPYKMWPKRYFAEIMDRLFEGIKAQFVFTGEKADKRVYDEILSWCRNRNKINTLNLCGYVSLRECHEIYKGMDFAVCIDSENAQVAAQAGIPVFILYGPTSPDKWLLLRENVHPVMLDQMLPCQPCDVKVKCAHLSCMKILTQEFVFGKLHKVLENYFERV